MAATKKKVSKKSPAETAAEPAAADTVSATEVALLKAQLAAKDAQLAANEAREASRPPRPTERVGFARPNPSSVELAKAKTKAESHGTEYFWLSAPRFLAQAGERFPKMLKASDKARMKVRLWKKTVRVHGKTGEISIIDTQEDQHLRRAPAPELLPVGPVANQRRQPPKMDAMPEEQSAPLQPLTPEGEIPSGGDGEPVRAADQ